MQQIELSMGQFKAQFIKALSITCFLIYFGYLFFLKSFHVPDTDELWFQSVAQNIGFKIYTQGIFEAIFHQTNHLGYGALYWIIYGCFTVVFERPIGAMRTLGFLATFAIPILILKQRYHQPFSKYLTLLFWLSLPMAYPVAPTSISVQFLKDKAFAHTTTSWHSFYQKLMFAIDNQYWTWDGVFSGGLFQWAFPAFLFFEFLLFLFLT